MAQTKKKLDPDSAAPAAQPQAGSIITPGGPESQPQPAPAPVVEKTPVKQAEPAQPQPTAAQASDQEAPQDSPTVTWTASEFVAHDKSAGWYFAVLVVSVLLSALAFLVTRDVVSVSVVIIAGLLMAVYGSHKPRQLEYTISGHSIGVGGKQHSFEEFRSFSIAAEGAFSSLVFMPLKRFAVPLTVYYAPADEQKILGLLADRLPFEEHRRDAVDGLLRRIRF